MWDQGLSVAGSCPSRSTECPSISRLKQRLLPWYPVSIAVLLHFINFSCWIFGLSHVFIIQAVLKSWDSAPPPSPLSFSSFLFFYRIRTFISDSWNFGFFFSKTEEIVCNVCKGIPALDQKINEDSNGVCDQETHPAAMTITARTHMILVMYIHVLKLSRNPVIQQTGRHLSRSLVQPVGFVKVSLRTITACWWLWTVNFWKPSSIVHTISGPRFLCWAVPSEQQFFVSSHSSHCCRLWFAFCPVTVPFREESDSTLPLKSAVHGGMTR